MKEANYFNSLLLYYSCIQEREKIRNFINKLIFILFIYIFKNNYF